MALKIANLYNKNYISQIGTEYVCTGFMFDMVEPDKSLPSQLDSFNFVGVVEDPGGSN